MRSFGYALGFVALCVGCLYLLTWNFERPPMSQQKMNSIKIGMTKAEVMALIGKPSNTYQAQWVYSRPLAWGAFKIDFDDVGKVKACDFDR